MYVLTKGLLIKCESFRSVRFVIFVDIRITEGTYQGIFKTGVFEIQGLLFFSYSIIDCQNNFYLSLVDYFISYLINVMVMHKEKLKKSVLVQDILE